MVEVSRCNLKIPNLDINQVGFCYRISEISYSVKTIHGIFEVLDNDLIILKDKYQLKPW